MRAQVVLKPNIKANSNRNSWRWVRRVHSPKGANCDSRFSSREAAKNAKERAFYGESAPYWRKFLRRLNSDIFAFFAFFAASRLCVRNAIRPNGGCTPLNRLQKFDWYDSPIPLVSECHEAWLLRIPLKALELRCCARVSLCGRHLQDCGGSGIAPATICKAHKVVAADVRPVSL